MQLNAFLRERKEVGVSNACSNEKLPNDLEILVEQWMAYQHLVNRTRRGSKTQMMKSMKWQILTHKGLVRCIGLRKIINLELFLVNLLYMRLKESKSYLQLCKLAPYPALDL